MIFFLLFSKSMNNSSGTLGRRLTYLCTVFFFAVVMFSIAQMYGLMEQMYVEQMYGQMEQAKSVFSGETLFPLSLLFYLFFMLGGDAIKMTRKDLDAAEIAFQAWVMEKKKGKQRFVLKRFAVALLAELPLMFLMAYPAVSTGANIITLVISGLIVIGIWLAIVISIWHLNIKYQDDVYRLLRPQGEMG